MSLECSYRLDLRFDGPVLSHAAGSLAFGLDAAMQRRHSNRGRPVLNGSLVRGNLLHTLRHFAGDILSGDTADRLTAHTQRWFGDESKPDTVEPNQATVAFDFFWESSGEEQPTDRRERYRIALDEKGRTKDGMLMVAEDCFGVGSSPEFSGCIHACFQNPEEQRQFEHWMHKALEYLPALGALKGVGYGRLERGELHPLPLPRPEPAASSTETPQTPQRLGLLLTLDRPFCIARPRTQDGNLLVSDDIIPGGLLKAVFARKLDDDAKQRLHFDDLLFTHALPTEVEHPQRATPMPLSLACHGDGVFDLFPHKVPCLLADDEGLHAPVFAPDWKQSQSDAAEQDWGEPPVRPPRLLSVRTAIERGSGIAAQSQLFSLECVDPEQPWCAEVDFDAIEEPEARQRVYRELCRLLAEGLDNIGKTKARAGVELRPGGFSPIERPEPLEGGLFLVTLVTPARLLPDDLQVSGINGDGVLGDYYGEYWKNASGEALRLSHYFAAEQRVGGIFHQGHYRAHKEGYRPEWLTRAGSVFVLEAGNDENAAADWLEKHQRLGLPPAQDRKRDTWETDPFIPQNGYGEIRVNLQRQIELSQPPEGLRYERA